MTRKCLFLCFLLFVLAGKINIKAEDRWVINPDGRISWVIKGDVPHADHIEMSGLKISTVLRYGVDSSGAFQLSRSVVWPMLRTVPNDTHASLTRRFAWNIPEMIAVNGKSLSGEQVKEISLRGVMTVRSEFDFPGNGKLELTRVLFPSVTLAAFCEKYRIRNVGQSELSVEVPSSRSEYITSQKKGVEGRYKLIAALNGRVTSLLQPGEEVSFSASFTGTKLLENEIVPDVDKELKERQDMIAGFWDNLILDTPDKTLNSMFAFAKIRAAESIYDTKGGLMHGPGGESYYAAVWANDQAEYVNPFFPFLGYETGNCSAWNSFKHFARFMNPGYEKLPSSIIAEGTDVWGGAGDRGDAAMIAYGAARYSLARGDRHGAEDLWPLIEWCLEYCKRNLNEQGVVASDADELENRFPAGKANLCTSSLYYDALLSAVYLGRDLGKPSAQLTRYTQQAAELRSRIDTYFGGIVEGFNTYRYYEGNDVLRSWICMPLTVGIYDRKAATIQALFSPRLWTENGLLTQAGSETFWDRSTLYALRGVFACGEVDKATDYLKSYSSQRLLGEHVPYAIEAWPEGSQRHLSAESGLYCRVITEGLFGIRPTGLNSFDITPHLPKIWNTMSLRKIRAFNTSFDVTLKRDKKKLHLTIRSGNSILVDRRIEAGETVGVRL